MSIYKIRTEFGKHIKWGLYVVAAVFVVGAAFQFGPWQGSGDKGKAAKDVIATVEGEDITRAEFAALQTQSEAQMKQMYPDSQLTLLQYADMQTYIIQQLIQNKLVLRAAEKAGVDLSNRKIDQAYDKEIVNYLAKLRATALGLTPEQAEKRKIDPRKDTKYKEQLKLIDRTIDDEINSIKAMIPRDAIVAKVATDELDKLFKSQAGKVTAADIKKSYDAYTLRQIIITEDKLPKEQAANQAKKIADEAKTGDFVALAKKYSINPSSGEPQELPAEILQGAYYPKEVSDAIYKLKPGQVSGAIKTDMAYFIVKLEKKENKMPANLDKKTKEEKRKSIMDARVAEKQAEFYKSIDVDKANIKVLDVELEAYWKLAQANQAFSDKKKYDKLQKEAIDLLEKSLKESTQNKVVIAKLAQLYQQTGQYEKAKKHLGNILNIEKEEDPSLYIMYGDVFAAQKNTKEALEQYKTASDIAQNDIRIHSELVQKYQQLGNAEMAAYEENKIKEVQANLEEWNKLKEEQKQKAPSDKK